MEKVVVNQQTRIEVWEEEDSEVKNISESGSHAVLSCFDPTYREEDAKDHQEKPRGNVCALVKGNLSISF